MNTTEKKHEITDSFLIPYLPIINKRCQYIKQKEQLLTFNNKISLYDFANYHLLFGLHSLNEKSTVEQYKSKAGWIFREWAPNAAAVYIIGVMTNWQIDEKFRLFKKKLRIDNNESKTDSNFSKSYIDVWERKFDKDAFKDGDLYRLKIFWNIGEGDRIPTCAARVVQDINTFIFNAQVWEPKDKYKWKHSYPIDSLKNKREPLLIYEAHTGMAQEEGKVGTFQEFRQNILPRIKNAGYNAIQLMAIQEHPYYGSFGYHVSNFFAPSSRFGTPYDLKLLVDSAHEMNIRIIMDIVHSHAVSNEVEGLSKFDGTLTQFFYDGERGFHKLWGSRCFDYSKDMVIKFLLSNCRYWIEEYRVDGFRFDGVTSMLYKDHGIGRSFTKYQDYFEDISNNNIQELDRIDHNDNFISNNSCDVDIDALSYLYLANKLIHKINPDNITIAEDVSGYPGLASQSQKIPNGIGFDYRFAMGIADFWIKLLKDHKDEEWELGRLWYELNAKRDDEKSISYAECHDQALVGDQTIMMRLMGSAIYSSMSIKYESDKTIRGVALHKMIRLITIAAAADGYLNFMGNEFGHPEWIDFPSIHNNWSYNFARRQWKLCDNKELYYYFLAQFDKDMIHIVKKYPFMSITESEFRNNNINFSQKANLLHIHEDNKVIAFKRETNAFNLIFIFNFNPFISFRDYIIDAPAGKYCEIMNSDEIKYGGKGRLVSEQIHFTQHISEVPEIYSDNVNCYKHSSYDRNYLSLYLPTRTAIVLLSNNE